MLTAVSGPVVLLKEEVSTHSFFFLTLDFVAESVGTEQHPSAESSHPHTDDPTIDSNLSAVLLRKTALLLF